MRVTHHQSPRVMQKAKYRSPFLAQPEYQALFVARGARSRPNQIPYDGAGDIFHTFELAGPSKGIIHQPSRVRALILNCGGLCPGFNAINWGLFRALNHVYKVPDGPDGGIWGKRHGYKYMDRNQWNLGRDYIEMRYSTVRGIQNTGGTILGTDRAKWDAVKAVENLVKNKINMVFVVGGDGTQRGAIALQAEILRRRLPISVIHLPKTVDGDLPLVDETFGFRTAVDMAARDLEKAHIEASQASEYGIWVQSVMGRGSGQLTVAAAVRNADADVVLIPEVPVKLEGSNGLFSWLLQELPNKGHFVIAVAEGVSEKIFEPIGYDESGNPKYPKIEDYLAKRAREFFEKHWESTLPRIYGSDPDFTARSGPPVGVDIVYCHQLASNAVHAAFGGYTGVMISKWQGGSVLVPMELAAQYQRRFDPSSELWRQALEIIGPRPYYTEAWAKVG